MNYPTDAGERELRLSKLLPAPVEQVWEVWSQPDHLAQWWGPAGFTNTIEVLDLFAGGNFDLIMHSPDETNYKNHSVFTSIIPFRKIAYDHISGPKFTATILFEPLGNQTLLNWHLLFPTAAAFEQVIKIFKADEGLQQNIEKLIDYLLQQP